MSDPYAPIKRFMSFPWAITFSDLCIVLLCFFILMASTTQTDPQRYAEISGSLQDHFGHPSSVRGDTAAAVGVAQSMPVDTTMSVLPAPTEALTLKPGHADPLPLLHDVNVIRQILNEPRSRQLVEVMAFGNQIKVQFVPVPTGNDVARLGFFQQVVDGVKQLDNARDELSHEVLVYGATDALLDAAGARLKSTSRASDDESRLLINSLLSSVETGLKQERQQGLVTVEKLSHSVRIRLGEAGAFAPGDAALTPQALQIVDRLGEAARQSGARIIIGGHTDTVPINTARYRDNWELSAARAIAVVRELVNHRGVDSSRIEAQGFGDTQPMTANDTPEHRATNRRIEITLELPAA